MIYCFIYCHSSSSLSQSVYIGNSKVLAPVVQTLDSAIHWITQLVLLLFICWIVIYPVDSAIHRLNTWGLVKLLGNTIQSLKVQNVI